MVIIANQKHALEAAVLHKQTIDQGFLSSLGNSFLTRLYKYLIKHELVLVLIENNKVLGFVSCALSVDGIMKKFISHDPAVILKILVSLLKKPQLIKPLFETYKAPDISTSDSKEIPPTELLSICVDPAVQSSGIGHKLLVGLEKELKNRSIIRYKVVAGDKLIGANKFYLKNGFKLTKQIKIHGDDISNVYVKDIV